MLFFLVMNNSIRTFCYRILGIEILQFIEVFPFNFNAFLYFSAFSMTNEYFPAFLGSSKNLIQAAEAHKMFQFTVI